MGWYQTVVPMKNPVNLLGQPDLTKHEIQEVVIQTTEPASTREDTYILVKIPDSNYVNSDLYKVDAAVVHLDIDQRKNI